MEQLKDIENSQLLKTFFKSLEQILLKILYYPSKENLEKSFLHLLLSWLNFNINRYYWRLFGKCIKIKEAINLYENTLKQIIRSKQPSLQDFQELIWLEVSKQILK